MTMAAILSFIGFVVLGAVMIGLAVLVLCLLNRGKKDEKALSRSSELHAYKYSNGSGLRIGR